MCDNGTTSTASDAPQEALVQRPGVNVVFSTIDKLRFSEMHRYRHLELARNHWYTLQQERQQQEPHSGDIEPVSSVVGVQLLGEAHTAETLSHKKISELRDLCRSMNCRCTGNKDVLITARFIALRLALTVACA